MKTNRASKTLSLLLAAIMVLGMIPCTSFADEISGQEAAMISTKSAFSEQDMVQETNK